jgi:hypothetical protein
MGIGDTIPIIVTSQDNTNVRNYYLIRGGWRPVGPDEFSQYPIEETILRVDTNGTLYAAFNEGPDDILSYRATVMKFNGTMWENVGQSMFTTGTTTNLSFLVNNDSCFLAFLDGALNPDKGSVMRFDGASWDYMGPAGFSQGDIGGTSIISNGKQYYLGYRDVNSDSKATVRVFNDSTWDTVGTQGFSTGIASNINLVSVGDTVYIGYSDNSLTGAATVKKFNGSGWVNVGSESISADPARSTQFAASTGGVLHIVYGDNLGKITMKKYNGSDWETVGSGLVHDNGDYLSLAFDGETPYVAFQDANVMNRATVRRFNGTSWEDVGNPGFSGGGADNPSLAIYDGIPYVLYMDNRQDHFKATVMEFYDPATR